MKLKDKEHCIFIRTNPDEKDFNIFKEINKIHRHVKKFLIAKISKSLLKFKLNHLTMTKTLKKWLKNILLNYKKYTIKNESYKNLKTTWNNILFWLQRLYKEF